MKKLTLLFLMLCVLLSGGSLTAQNVKFKKYFDDATLRIDYYRVGNRQQDSIRMESVEKLSRWAGSLTQLLDPFDNGAYRVVVLSIDGKELYSRGYNSLFHEYIDTPQGKDSVAAFQEVLRLSWPKKRWISVGKSGVKTRNTIHNTPIGSILPKNRNGLCVVAI